MAKNSGTKKSVSSSKKTSVAFPSEPVKSKPLKGVATLPQAPNLGTTFCVKVVNHVLGQSVNHVPLDRASSPTEGMAEGKTSKEIYLTLGFSSQAYFVTLFRRFYDMTPSEYVKLVKTED